MEEIVMDRVKDRKAKQGSKLKQPPKYDIVVFNNDVSPFDAVVFILVRAFNLEIPEAGEIAAKAHLNGKAIVVRGVTREIAGVLLDTARKLSLELDSGRLKFDMSESK